MAQVAKWLAVKPERIEQWERGDRKPTVRQAQKLAKVYHRPLGVFFLPQPPSLPPLAAEYRRLPGVRPGIESPELRYAIRLMSLRRQAVSCSRRRPPRARNRMQKGNILFPMSAATSAFRASICSV